EKYLYQMSNFKLIIKYAFLDLKNQKIRTLLAIFGMLISIGLLTTVLFLSDSISSSYVDYLTIDSGNQDAVISVRHYNGEPENRSSYFKYKPVIETIQNTSDVFRNFIPRLELYGIVKVSEDFNTTNLTEKEEWCMMSAINFSLEDHINFGTFNDPNKNEILKLDQLPTNHCAIYYGFNNVIKYAKNDEIEIEMELTHGNRSISIVKNLTIDAIIDFNLKWPNDYRNNNLIIVDINTIYELFGNTNFTGRCSKLILTLKESYKLYDIRDFEGSKINIKEIASDVQIALGLKEFTIDLPKLRVLGYSEFLSVLIVVVFVFVSIIAMLISGVLINGILKTSVEERIREFGIFRTLGTNKKYNLYIVLMQGFLLCNFGTISGIIAANFITIFIIIPFANSVISISGIGFTNLVFSFSLWSVIISYIIGISVGMVVSIFPAVKVMRLQLIESIHPYRHEDTLYHLQKKSTVNYKLILIGIILVINAGFVFLVIPRIIIAGNLALFAGTLIAILLIFNIGLTLAGLGLIPLILRMIIELFRPIARHLYNIIKIFVFRYQRRNSSTVIIFALSFSFVIFTSTVINTLSAQSTAMTKLSYGSDLVIETSGWKEQEAPFQGGFGGGFMSMDTIDVRDNLINNIRTQKMEIVDSFIDPNEIMTIEFEEELLSIDGIEKVSSVLAKPFQLTQIYSEEEKEFSAEIGDYAGLSTQEITLIGIDEEYLFTVKNEFIEMTSGNLKNSFTNLFNEKEDYTCIISEAISIAFDFNLNDKIRIVIHRGDELEVYPFKIVGMAKSIPGFRREFGASRSEAFRGGVLISQKTYIEIMDIPPIPYLDRIFIKVREDKGTSVYNIETIINDNYHNDYNFELYNLKRRVAQQQSSYFVLDTLFSLIALTTVFICIFGLLSSSYSTIIERKKEIGIVRTLGLKGKEINRLFIIESLIIMISSGTIGIITGWLSAWIVTSNLSTMIGMPNVIYIPWFNMILIFSVSIIIILIGMRILLRKARKKKIVEIYRETM
ncbi:MAG: ABC transporter permease, partial [Promethearchaeota archaeon]